MLAPADEHGAFSAARSAQAPTRLFARARCRPAVASVPAPQHHTSAFGCCNEGHYQGGRARCSLLRRGRPSAGRA
ncbi:hypothetical protein BN440_3158 [Erwinia amylovora MR1]|nr:hypothetical protein BN440_3158 [Erwinia amylovora MR1]